MVVNGLILTLDARWVCLKAIWGRLILRCSRRTSIGGTSMDTGFTLFGSLSLTFRSSELCGDASEATVRAHVSMPRQPIAKNDTETGEMELCTTRGPLSGRHSSSPTRENAKHLPLF